MEHESTGGRVLRVADASYTILPLEWAAPADVLDRLPYCIKVLLENVLAQAAAGSGSGEAVARLAGWRPDLAVDHDMAFAPGRVLLQDFTGVPAIVDLAAMRDALAELGGDPALVKPGCRSELVIDHSVIADVAGRPDAFERNASLEFDRNRERYAFLRWGQQGFANLRVVPPDTGIVHQINLEYLARVVAVDAHGVAHPDTLVGTDSHTTMVNGLGVVGWGVGGIEAEAALLGQPLSMLIPKVVGVRLSGRLRVGSTATDLVLTIAQLLRAKGVVGQFVEFFGPGLAGLPVADRATIGNMSPEYGSTCAIFPIDDETLRYLRLTGRPAEQVALVEAYAKQQGLFHGADASEADYSEVIDLDLGSVVPSIAGPARPQDRRPASDQGHGRRHGSRARRQAGGGADGARGQGSPKNLDECDLTLTGKRCVNRIISDPVTLAPGLTAEQVRDKTGADADTVFAAAPFVVDAFVIGWEGEVMAGLRPRW